MTPTTTTFPAVDAPPVLIAKLDGRSVPMHVEGLEVDIHIAGLASETSMLIVFGNLHDRDLEGEILFPLPEGAALCGYALNVDGELLEASLVGKSEAREIFGEEVRKGIDPGVLEHETGNRFRTRIYPVPAGGRRTVRVTWAQPLGDNGGTAIHELPLRFSAPEKDVSEDQAAGFPAWAGFFTPATADKASRDSFRLRVTVAKSEALPELPGAAEDLGFEDRGDRLGRLPAAPVVFRRQDIVDPFRR